MRLGFLARSQRFRIALPSDYVLLSLLSNPPIFKQKIEDVDEKRRRLVELNVQESCINLFANPIVQKKQGEDARY